MKISHPAFFMKKFLVPLFLVFLHQSVNAQAPATDAIRLNQVGFYPQTHKTAVVVGAKEGKFT